MTNLSQKLNEIFIKVQEGPSEIQLKRLQKLYQQSNFEKFLREFLKCMNIILKTKYDQDPYRDKLLTFASKFCTSLNSGNEESEIICPFLKEIFTHLFKEFNGEVISRYRVSQFIKLLLKEIGEQNAFLDEDICIEIRDLMLERIDDFKVKVRIEAIEVLQRLQDPMDNNDIIIKTFIEQLSDENFQVRKHIIQSIGLNITSIPVVVGRCLDVNEEVRLVSFDKLSKIPIKALKIAQRQFIIRNGFNDKSTKVRNFIIQSLLPQWLSTFKDNYFQLILALKLDADEQDFKRTTDVIEKVLEVFFKNTALSTILEALPLGRDKLTSSSENLWEEIIFWRCLHNFLLQNEEASEYIDKILPELRFFCEYMLNIFKTKSQLTSDWEIVQHDFIIFELLKICYNFDYSDEVGRNALQNLITTILIDGPPNIYESIQLIIKILEKLLPDNNERASKISEIVSEIQTPLTPSVNEELMKKRDEKLRQYKDQLFLTETEIEIAIDKEDYDKASDCKKLIQDIKDKMSEITKDYEIQNNLNQRTQKNDSNTLCRCLDILAASLESSKLKTLPEPYRAYQELFLPPLFETKYAEVFWRALRQLCLFANFDKVLAQNSMKIFCTSLVAHKYRPVHGDQTTIMAIKCVTDMILLHGAEVFVNQESLLNVTDKPTNKRKIFERKQIDESACSEPPPATLEFIIEVLSDLLDDTIDNIREVSTECLITLIMTGRIRSPALFSKLILKWFSPNTSKDIRIRQMIGRLFTDFVAESPNSLETIEEAFIPSLQAVIDAPKNSPLADIDIDSFGRFLAALSQPGRHKYNIGLDSHKNISLQLCKEICERPNNKRTLVYLKLLMNLERPSDDESTLNILRKQTDIMQEIIKEKSCLRYVTKYRQKLDNDLTEITNIGSAATIDNPTLTNNSSAVTTINIVVNASNYSETNINPDSNTNLTELQKEVKETSKYSALSVKRKKRSRGNGMQTNMDLSEGSNEKSNKTNVSTNITLSETDSDCSQSNEQNKKKNNWGVQKELYVRLERNEKIDKMYAQKIKNNMNFIATKSPKKLPNNTTKTNNIIYRDIRVLIERNQIIEDMCLKRIKINKKLSTRSSLRLKKKRKLT